MSNPQWQTAKLSDLVSPKRGLTYSADELVDAADGGLAYYNMKSFKKEGGLNPEGDKWFSGVVPSSYLLGENDVLIANTDVTPDSDIIGSPTCVPSGNWGRSTFSHHVTRLSIVSRAITAPFLFRSLLQYSVRKSMRAESRGTTVKMLDVDGAMRVRVPVPPLDEQRRIAAILDASEATIRATEAVIEKLRLEREGLIVESIESQWGNSPVMRLAELTVSHDAGIYIHKSLYGTGSNIVGVGDLFRHASIDGQVFSRAQIQPHEVDAYTLREGDLLYAESSLVLDGIAKTLHVTSAGAGTLFAWHTRRIRLNKGKVDPFFAALALSAPTCRRFIMSRATQTALTGMPVAAYLETPVPVPGLVRQREISDLAHDSDLALQTANKQLAKLRLQHQGLLHDLLTGAVRTHA